MIGKLNYYEQEILVRDRHPNLDDVVATVNELIKAVNSLQEDMVYLMQKDVEEEQNG